MIGKVRLENFGPLPLVQWEGFGKINLIIGFNGSGKTFLLKALYTAIRTLELYKRGKENRTAAEILADKLYWTYQSDQIGDLVKKQEKTLSFFMDFDGCSFEYSFGRDTKKQIASIENHVSPRDKENSIFLPAKEVLSIHDIILKSREDDQAFGFDDTYLDLARALRPQPKQGRNFKGFSDSRKKLEQMIGGRIAFDLRTKAWYFTKGKQSFPLGVTAEGVKKIAILDTLLSNRHLGAKSIIFIDEPESALHPKAISTLLEIVAILAKQGIQFFMASHSYFVIKKLHLIAKHRNISIPVFSLVDDQGEYSNLKDEMPDNPIINESIRLYQEEVDHILL
ncbi:MAG: ATP-binding protein [bacterium]|nr:ATP-binding protein [bacterium]